MVGKTRALVAAISLLAIGLSGCGQFGAHGGDNFVTIGGQGQKAGTETKTLSCAGGTGTVSVGGQGEGRMRVTIDDGGGEEIFRKQFSGSEQSGEVTSLNGDPGTWTLTVDFGAAFGIGAWNGQYGITLTCSNDADDA